MDSSASGQGSWRGEAGEGCITFTLQRILRFAGHVARMGKMRNASKILVENLKGRDHLEYLGVDGKIIEWILGA